VWPASVSVTLRTTGRQAARQVSQPRREPAAVILAVMPPRTTSKTGREGRQVRYELADDRLAGALRELARVVLDSPACPAHLEPRP
jgi:hypothetical protein